MEKQYLYLLLSIFIFLNGVDYFDESIKQSIKSQELYKTKLEKQSLYKAKKSEIELLIQKQNEQFLKNRKLFFKKSKKGTIVFSEIQEQIQTIMKNIGGKITHLNSGIAIEGEGYRKYPISLSLTLIPEDLDDFFKHLHSNKKYLFVDDIHISKDAKEQQLRLKITMIGYQLK